MGKSAGTSLSLFFPLADGRGTGRTRDQRSPHADLDSAEADDLWTQACGKDRWLGTTKTLEQDIRRVSDARLWHFRIAASESLVAYAANDCPAIDRLRRVARGG